MQAQHNWTLDGQIHNEDKMKTNWILPMVGIGFMVLFLYLYFSSYIDCSRRGGVIVQSLGGWSCVEEK